MSQPLVSPASVANQSAAKKGEERAVLSGQQDRATKEAKMKQTNFAGGVNPKPVNPSDADAGKQKNVASSEIISTESAAPSIGNEFGNDNIDKLPESMDAAMESFNNRNYKAAAKQFGKIADKDPTNLDAVYFEGISHFINGDNNKALKNFEKLLHKGAKHTDGAKWYKAQILLKKGKIEEAKKLLNELKETTGSFRDRAVNKLKELE
jgi:tetratricopeptide (TPR) repeat protein